MRKLVVLFASLVILLVMFGALGFGQEKYIPKPNEEIYGTWVNEQMNPPKTVNNPDGTFADYFPASYSKPFRGGTTEIFKKWTDSEGSVYYDTFDTFTSGMGIQGMKTQCLKKVSKSGTVLEWNWVAVSEFGPEKFPSTLDTKSEHDIAGYFIYYRAKE
ncbi:MAG: hypothetical protein ABSG38_14705 [Spirochaetia bacterium]|jgi:hypothetical protein